MTTISWFHGSVACVFLLFFIQLVQEVEVAGGKRVIIVFVPVPQIAKYQKLIKEVCDKLAKFEVPSNTTEV